MDRRSLLRSVRLDPGRIEDPAAFPFALPAVAALREQLALHPEVALVLARGPRTPSMRYFLRAERFFNVARRVDAHPGALAHRGGRPTAYEDTDHDRLTRAFSRRRTDSCGRYSRSSRRRILPVAVFGTSSMISTWRGYL